MQFIQSKKKILVYTCIMYAMLLSGIPYNMPQVTCIFLVYTHAFSQVWLRQVKAKGQVRYSRVFHEKALHNYFIQSHRKYSEKEVGCNTVEHAMAFLYSDWLYVLWHSIKYHITQHSVLFWSEMDRVVLRQRQNHTSTYLHTTILSLVTRDESLVTRF